MAEVVVESQAKHVKVVGVVVVDTVGERWRCCGGSREVVEKVDGERAMVEGVDEAGDGSLKS